MDLNERQREAVEAEDKALLITAGPGTGKTRTFAARAARLISRGVPPERVLAVSFTRSAAGEMRERLEALGVPVERAWIETFHAAAARLLKEEGRVVSLASEEEKIFFLDGLVAPRERMAFLDGLRRAKQALREPEDETQAEYQRRLKSAGKLDFDDLFLNAVGRLKEDPEARRRWQGRFLHALIDEFQDTSFAQYTFLSLLTPEHICAVGDPDQAIYGFASGGFRPFERFRTDHPRHRLVSLSENYRSQSDILAAARLVIAPNHASVPRELVARLEKGLPIEAVAYATPSQEAEMIGRRVESLLGGGSRFTRDTGWVQDEEESGRYGLGDIAVLYRFNALGEPVARALERLGLPCRVYGRKDDPAEDLDEFRHAPDAAPPAELPRHEKISLMSLHRSKGLEFPVVFIAGCEEGLLPAAGADPEEERRLFYVGVTRARSRLFLTCAKSRRLFGRSLSGRPSPFLADIEGVARVIEAGRSRGPRPAKQGSLFDMRL